MDDEAFARMLQQQLLDEERMLMEQQQRAKAAEQVQVQRDPRGYSTGTQVDNHNPYNYHRETRTYHPEPYKYSGQPRHEAGQVPQNHDMHAMSSMHPPNSMGEDPDLALARRMQEMEASGQYNGPGYNPTPQASHHQVPYSSPGVDTGTGRSRMDQEEEDARLARMLAQTDQSFRTMTLSAPNNTISNDLPPHNGTRVAPNMGQPPNQPSQPMEPPLAHQDSGFRSPDVYPSMGQEGSPYIPENAQPQIARSRGAEIDVTVNQMRQNAPQMKSPPQYPPHYQQQPPQQRRMNDSSPQGVPVRSPVPQGVRGVPTNPRGNYPPAAAPRSMDPVQLNEGPLQAAGNRPPARGNFAQPIDLPPMMNNDVLLDVPATPSKKEKTKKKGLMKMFGRNGGEANSKNVKQEKPRGLFGGKGRNRSASNNQNEIAIVEDSKPPAQPSEAAQPRVAPTRNEDESVRFKMPEPVPRPADTIGAPKGPLPYSLSVSKDAPELQEATVGRRPQLSLARSSATCCVCNRPAQNPLSALDKKYHIECFRCISCSQPIDPTGAFAFMETGSEKQPMHRKCYAEIFGIKCCVCEQSIPAGPDGKVSFVKHPFFDTEQMCPRHARNMTRRCTGCHRFEPENEPFADLNDVGRCVCMSCCRSVVVDSQDAQPLWAKVVDFFDKHLNMPIWKDFREIPILVVGYNALNDQMNKTNSVHLGASQIMTRGLCLTEHESGRRFRMNRMKFDKNHMSFVACDAEERGFTFFQVPDASKSNPDASVTAILLLSGLPRELAASVLAHEATHAWIKLHPRFDFERPIPAQVEEGCCQLIALLFLNEGLDPPIPLENNDGSGPSDEKLRQYFKFSIETDDHEIYGTGYRKAAMAYSKIGIEALMSHIVLYQDFPEI